VEGQPKGGLPHARIFGMLGTNFGSECACHVYKWYGVHMRITGVHMHIIGVHTCTSENKIRVRRGKMSE